MSIQGMVLGLCLQPFPVGLSQSQDSRCAIKRFPFPVTPGLSLVLGPTLEAGGFSEPYTTPHLSPASLCWEGRLYFSIPSAQNGSVSSPWSRSRPVGLGMGGVRGTIPGAHRLHIAAPTPFPHYLGVLFVSHPFDLYPNGDPGGQSPWCSCRGVRSVSGSLGCGSLHIRAKLPLHLAQ